MQGRRDLFVAHPAEPWVSLWSIMSMVRLCQPDIMMRASRTGAREGGPVT